jgi:hypothetical protein
VERRAQNHQDFQGNLLGTLKPAPLPAEKQDPVGRPSSSIAWKTDSTTPAQSDLRTTAQASEIFRDDVNRPVLTPSWLR